MAAAAEGDVAVHSREIPPPEAEASRARALAVAREKAEGEALTRAAAAKRKARRGWITKGVVGGMFVIMLFERAVNGGWFG